MKEIAEKYGRVLLVKLKTFEVDGKKVSSGNAKVYYEKKEDAFVAM